MPRFGAAVAARIRRIDLVALAAMVILAFGLQFLSKAHHGDLWGYDETAHFVSSLAVHDYLVSPPWGDAREFVRSFNEHYPKVAIGHWPPVFHFAQGLWMLVFSAHAGSALAMIALCSALTGWLVYRVWRPWAGPGVAAGAGLALIALPLIQAQTFAVMTEMFLVLLVVLAMFLAERFFDRPTVANAVLFALITSAAILTKPNAWALPIAFGLALVLACKFRVLLQPGVWIAGAIVAALCIPWYLLTLPEATAGYRTYRGAQFLFFQVALFNLTRPAFTLGATLSILAAAGMLRRGRMALQGPLGSRWACAMGAVLGFWLFQSFVAPVQETRHSVYVLPFLLGFAADAAVWLMGIVRERFPSKPAAVWVLPALILTGFFVEKGRIIVKADHRSIPAARWVISAAGDTPATMLVSANGRGESAFVASLAERDKRPRHTVILGTKSVATARWAGQGYRMVMTSQREVLDLLRSRNVRWLVLDTTPALVKPKPHHTMLERIVRTNPNLFWRAADRATTGSFEIWEFQAGR